MQEPSYVSPLFAAYLGVAMNVQALFAVNFLAADVDPRFEVDADTQEGHDCVELAMEFPSGAAGSSVYMDSQHTVEPGAPTGSLKPVSCCPALPSERHEHCVSDSLYSDSRHSVHREECQQGLPLIEHALGHGKDVIVRHLRPRLGPSCLKGSSRRPQLRVRFSFEVQFWFPSPCQLRLSAASLSRVAAPSTYDFHGHLPVPAVICQGQEGTDDTISTAWHVGIRQPTAQHAQHRLCTESTASLAWHVGFRPPIECGSPHFCCTAPCPGQARPADFPLQQSCTESHLSPAWHVGVRPPLSDALVDTCSSPTPESAWHVGIRPPLTHPSADHACPLPGTAPQCPGHDAHEDFQIFEDAPELNSEPVAPHSSGLMLPSKVLHRSALAEITNVHDVDAYIAPLGSYDVTPISKAATRVQPHSKARAGRFDDTVPAAEARAHMHEFPGDPLCHAQGAQGRDDARAAIATAYGIVHVDPYSSFDAVRGTRVLNGQPAWQESHYVAFALTSANLPGNPIGRTLRVEVASHPSPQVILTQDHAGAFYRAVLFELQDIGGPLQVIDVTPLHTVAIALREVIAPSVYGRLCDDFRSGRAVCFVNRLPADPFETIVPDADRRTHCAWHLSCAPLFCA